MITFVGSFDTEVGQEEHGVAEPERAVGAVDC